jgi:serine/threonine protein kinase
MQFSEEISWHETSRCFSAFDTETCCEVGWNVMQIHSLPSEKKRRELQSHLQRLHRLKHPNIVQSRAAWLDDSKKLVIRIYDLFTGGSVAEVMKRGRLPTRRVVRQWSLDILKGLAYLHAQSPPILVKSLSTDSIVLDNCSGEVKLAEYGLDCCFVNLESFTAGKDYSAPEMYFDQITPAVDVYSFGLCLLEIVTQERPYLESPSLSCTVKRKLNGVLPMSLDKLQDPQVKDLIQLCLSPYENRPTVADLLTHQLFAEVDEKLDCLPIKMAQKPTIHEIALSLPVTVQAGGQVVVEFKYQPFEDTPDSVARQLTESLGLPTSQVIKLASEIRKLVAIEDSKLITSSLQLLGAVRENLGGRKSSLLEFEPVVSLIPISIRLLIPGFSTPCRVDFSYILNVDKPDVVANELIHELKLTQTSQPCIEDEVRRLVRTKQKVSVGLQTQEEDLTTTDPSECSSPYADAGLSNDDCSSPSSSSSDTETQIWKRNKREKWSSKGKLLRTEPKEIDLQAQSKL